MRYYPTLLASGLAALLLGTPAFAADDMSPTELKPAQGAEAPVKNAPKLESRDSTQSGQSAESHLIGAPLFTTSGEEVGEIVGLAGQGQGQSSHAILSFGGFMGFGEDHVLVPVDTISIIDGQPVTTLTESDLEVLPTYAMPQSPSPSGTDGEGATAIE